MVKAYGVVGDATVAEIGRIDRRRCRRRVEENFTIERMVAAYERVYEQILG
jgi:hypothetical protein